MAESVEKRPVFELSSGDLCLDLANTWGDRSRKAKDRLTGYAALLAWGRQAGVLSARDENRLARIARASPRKAERAFRSAVELRETLYRLFSAAAAGRRLSASDVAALNRRLEQSLPNLRLVHRNQGFDWAWSGSQSSLDRMVWPVVRAAAELLTSDLCDRVRECDSETCNWLFIDRSRAGRRRWCDMKVCGNRAKARRHYRRRKESATSSP